MLRLVGKPARAFRTVEADYSVVCTLQSADVPALAAAEVRVRITPDDRWTVQVCPHGEQCTLTLTGTDRSNPAHLMREVLCALFRIAA